MSPKWPPGSALPHDSRVVLQEAVERTNTWAGPLQHLDVNALSPAGRYNFGYSIQADSPVEIQWKLKVLMQCGP